MAESLQITIVRKSLSLYLFLLCFSYSCSGNDSIEKILAKADKARDSGRYEQAFEQYSKAADRGDTRAQNELGTMYKYGYGSIEMDYEKAMEWFLKSANQNNPEAQVNVGLMYKFGYAVDENLDEAIKWFQKAVEQDYAEGKRVLSGAYVEQGKKYVGHLDKKACGLFLKASEFNNADAQARVSLCIMAGILPSKHPAEDSFKILKKSADQGEIGAQSSLGTYYLAGIGTDKNCPEAVRLIRLVANATDSNSEDSGTIAGAQALLGTLYEDGRCLVANEFEAVKWYRLSAERGHTIAQYLMCRAYMTGHAVPKDLIQAYAWCNLAAAKVKFHPMDISSKEAESARYMRSILEQVMTPEQITRAQALSRSWMGE